MAGRHRRQPIEQSFLARDLGEQHHAEQKQINVAAFGDAGERIRNGNQPECYQQGGTDHGPNRFGEIEGTQDDARSRDRSDDVDRLCCVGLHGGT